MPNLKSQVRTCTLRVLTATMILASGFAIKGQQTPAQFDARILPSLERLTAPTDVERVQEQFDGLEKAFLRKERQNKDRYCEALFNFVVFRYKLHRTAASVTEPTEADPVDKKKRESYRDLRQKNVLRAEDLFAKGEKECSFGGEPTETYLMAKFANTWLFDNVHADRLLAYDLPKLDKERERILSDYEFLLKEFRSQNDHPRIDPVLLLYSFGNALLQQGQFEKAEPLLSECLTLASTKYGINSPTLMPILRLLAGIAYTAGDQSAQDRYATLIDAVNGGSAKDNGIVFNIRWRATSESKPAFTPERPIMVFGPRQVVEGRVNREASMKDVTADLPHPVGQNPHDNNLIGMISGGSWPIRVFITVDELGNVTDADVRSSDEKIRSKLKETAMTLKFRPMIYKGHPTSMKGFVVLYIKR